MAKWNSPRRRPSYLKRTLPAINKFWGIKGKRKRTKYYPKKGKRPLKMLINGKPIKKGTSAWQTFGGAIRRKGKAIIGKLDRLLADQIRLVNASGQVAVTIGRQTVTNIQYEYNSTDCTAQAAGAAYKVILKSCQSKILLTNNTNQTMFVTLYDWVCRRDSNVAQTPVDYWEDSVAASAAATDPTLLGTTPFDSDLFTSTFKVLKVTKIYLGAGEVCEHVKSIQLNKVYDDAIIAYTIGGNQLFKGITHGTFMVSHGQPVGDDADTDVTLAGTNAEAMYWVASKKFRYQYVQTAQHSFNVDSTLPTGTLTGGAQIMETDGDGANGLVVGS